MKKPDDHDEGQGRSGSKEVMNSKGQTEITSTQNKESSSSNTNSNSNTNNGKQSSSKAQQPTNSSESRICSRLSRQSPERPNMFQVQTVLHGGSITTTLGAESPRRRSRSPSPRVLCRSPSPVRKSVSGNKNNKLIRPSSANMSGRSREKKKESRKSCTESSPSRKSKVYFEGELPPRESIFSENVVGSNIVVDLKDDRPITFEDIDAELNALRADIQNVNDRMLENEESLLSDEDYEILSVNEESDNDSINKENEETSHETGQDYTELLEMYRQKCINFSENCGEISMTLTTPRRSRSLGHLNNGRKSRSDSKNSTHKRKGSMFSETSLSGMIDSDRDGCGLKRVMSELTISDSGISEISSDLIQSKVQSRVQSAKLHTRDKLSDPTMKKRPHSASYKGRQSKYNVPKLDLWADNPVLDTEASSGVDVDTARSPAGQRLNGRPKSVQDVNKPMDSTTLLELVCEELNKNIPEKKQEEKKLIK